VRAIVTRLSEHAFNSTMLDSDPRGRLARIMRQGLLVLCCLTCLGGCGGLPKDQRAASPDQSAHTYPALEPLGALIAQAQAQPPRNAEAEGQSLAARAADLQRRAALLRQMPL